jgi:hypothetical protein
MRVTDRLRHARVAAAITRAGQTPTVPVTLGTVPAT